MSLIINNAGAGATLGANVFTGNQDIDAAGVRLAGAAGVLTLTGLAGTAENLTLDFSASNVVSVGTGTGVTKLDFGTLILEGKHNSSDGSAGVSGTGTVISAITVKDGIITAITVA